VPFAAVSSTLQRMASRRPHIDLPVGVVSSLSRPRRWSRPVFAYSPVNRQERSPPRDPHTPRRPINMDESPEAGKVRGFVTPARRTSSGGMGQKLLGGLSRKLRQIPSTHDTLPKAAGRHQGATSTIYNAAKSAGLNYVEVEVEVAHGARWRWKWSRGYNACTDVVQPPARLLLDLVSTTLEKPTT